MKNIHILPTDKPSRLFEIDGHLIINREQLIQPKCYRNIYITSDEEIKKGDWVYDNDANQIVSYKNLNVNPNLPNFPYYKKITLTTDQDLIKDGVQAIDDEFLEWFVNNPSCEYVEVTTFFSGIDYPYEIIIPKEEPITLGKIVPKERVIGLEKPKQETLEEALKKYYEENIDQSNIPREHYEWEIQDLMSGFAYKWQQKRSYSEEDMAESFMACWKANVPEGFECKLSFNEWFEQNKKK